MRRVRFAARPGARRWVPLDDYAETKTGGETDAPVQKGNSTAGFFELFAYIDRFFLKFLKITLHFYEKCAKI
ncbi:hypothetical protein OBV_07500 [Oscillibacter valericigenes Sjm18-20]|nr:hypothetical protein OBV_07500 [Oscillibacter valericigenes Sjm18-20]